MKHENLSYKSHSVHLILLLGETSNAARPRVTKPTQYEILNSTNIYGSILYIAIPTECRDLVLLIREVPGSNPVGYPGKTSL